MQKTGITEHVHSVKITFRLIDDRGIKIDRFVYVYFIYYEKITMINTGITSEDIPIFNYLREAGRDTNDISRVVLTHSHPDHIRAARAVKEATGCAIAAHRAEKTWIEHVKLQARVATRPELSRPRGRLSGR